MSFGASKQTVQQYYKILASVQDQTSEHTYIWPMCNHFYVILFLFQAGYLCNNAHIQDGSLFGQPTEGALVAVAQKVQLFAVWLIA